MSQHGSEVWEESFRHKLLIRPKTQHAKCSQCIRHKLVLRKVRKNIPARRAQLALYKLHLEKQYEDRTTYWTNRTNSRSKHLEDGSRTLTITIDSMDHSKFAFPRAMAMTAKEFSTFIRPTLACTAVISHGYSFCLYLSEPHQKHDSAWTSDLLAHTLQLVCEQNPDFDLKSTNIKVHGDNSSKELKNNSCCRLLGGLVLCRRIRSADLCYLQSGHSHEDIDQVFSGLARYLDGQNELHVPMDFLESLTRWVNTPGFRPHEPHKAVFMVDQTRDWWLD